MKKVIITLACMLTLGAIQAQESKEGIINEYSVSMGNIKNYSSMSLFQDASTGYSMILGDILVGYRFNNNMITFAYEYGSTHTSALHLNEQMEQNSFLLGYRNYIALNDRIDFFVGTSIGMSKINNTFDYNEEHYKFKRWGIHADISTGLQYDISKTSYCGINLKLPVTTAIFDNEIKLPLGLENNPVKRQIGYQITVTYGIKF